MIDVPLKNAIREYIPDWIEDKHPIFLEFFQAYYEWLELDGNPVDVIRNFSDYIDIDRSIDSFIEYFKADIIPELPSNTASDKTLYLKHIDDLYQSKGTVASFKLLFRILYNEPIEVIFPRDKVLRLSSSPWVNKKYSIKVSSNNDLGVFDNRHIESRRYTTDTSYTLIGEADVQEVVRYNVGSYIVTELFISNVVGSFEADDTIHFGDYSEHITPTVTNVVVTNGGLDYAINREVFFDTTTQLVRHYTFTNSNDFDLGVTSVYTKDDLEVFVNDVLVDPSNLTFDGIVLNIFLTLVNGDLVKVNLPAIKLYAVTKSIDSVSSLEEITILNHGIGYTTAPVIDLSREGNGLATAEFSVGGMITYDGKYTNTQSMLSASSYLYDGYYYQDYSYVIKSSISLDKFGSIFKKLVHPSGFNLFNIIQIVAREVDDNIGVSFSEFAYDITTILYDTYESELSLDSPTTIQFEQNKLTLGDNYHVQDVLNMKIDTLINKRYINETAPVNIQITP